MGNPTHVRVHTPVRTEAPDTCGYSQIQRVIMAFLILGNMVSLPRMGNTMPARPPLTSPAATAKLKVLGEQIRARCEALGTNATVTAEAAGMSRVTLHRIEKGEKDPGSNGAATFPLQAPPGLTRGCHSYNGSSSHHPRFAAGAEEAIRLIHCKEFAGEVAAAIELAMTPANSWRVSTGPDGTITWSGGTGGRWTHEPATGFWHRVGASFLRVVPLEKYL